MKAVQDFNYKVALASGLKHLQGGKLRQAEEQFRYLVAKFPRADGGYRGLARVYVELGDKAAALASLRDGAAALARSGDRALAIDLLRDATTLDPLDLAAHRRLAAALALAGDVPAAAQEYVRFAQEEISAGDVDRARLEASYALETFGEIPALHDLARSVGVTLRTVRPVPPESAALGEGPAPLAPEGPAPRGARATTGELAVAAGPEPEPSAPADADAMAAVARPLAAVEHPAPAAAAPVDPLVLEERAMSLVAARDRQAGKAAIEAASALLASGKLQAASDLLLSLVASGMAVHGAERELIGVARALGREDLADARADLLARALRLAGDEERAAEVERIKQGLPVG